MRKLHPNDKLTDVTFTEQNQTSFECYLHQIWPWFLGYFEQNTKPYYFYNDGETIVTELCDVSVWETNESISLVRQLQTTKTNSHGMWSMKTREGFVKQLVPAINSHDDVVLVFRNNEDETDLHCFHLHRKITSGELTTYAFVVPKLISPSPIIDHPTMLMEILADRCNFQPNFSVFA